MPQTVRRPLLPALLLAVLAALLAGCVVATGDGDAGETSEEAAVTESRFDLATAEIVDLTWAYSEDTLYWPTSPSDFELEVLAHGETEGGYFYSANVVSTPEHGGTHLDAPIHFGEGQWTAAEIPAERFVAPAVVIDVSRQASEDADYVLTRADVEAWEAEHGEVPEGSVVLLRTAWSERWPDRLAYFGDDTPGDASNLHFPSYGAESAELLVNERGVIGLGVDTASIDHGASTDFMAHRIAAAENVYGLENLKDLGRLPPTGAWVVALPMKIEQGSGGPARVVALLPRG